MFKLKKKELTKSDKSKIKEEKAGVSTIRKLLSMLFNIYFN